MTKITKKDFEKYEDIFHTLAEDIPYIFVNNFRGDYGDWHGCVTCDFSDVLVYRDHLSDIKFSQKEFTKTFSAKTFDELCEKILLTINFIKKYNCQIDYIFEKIDEKIERIKQDWKDDTDMLYERIEELEKELEIARAVVGGLNSRPGRKM